MFVGSGFYVLFGHSSPSHQKKVVEYHEWVRVTDRCVVRRSERFSIVAESGRTEPVPNPSRHVWRYGLLRFPETDPSLLIRLRDMGDQRAWEEFVDLYRPAIVAFARRCGLQDSDSEDLAQGVLIAVAKSVESWRTDENRARFRTWLHTVANRLAIDAFRRKARSGASGGTSLLEFMELQPDQGGDSRMLGTELRRQIFRRAAADARHEFALNVWESFRLTAIDGLSAADAAAILGKTAGAVYAAKARVMKRVVQRVRELEEVTGEIAVPDSFLSAHRNGSQSGEF